ncbi:deoxyribodipyrimidine photo-lyase [Runella sp. MFBS21]|uniref:cryptochrome/photolyase family protein n=1 Tax=Runella sp. MFBS21 TaxID=3034018 RepID=UPI0023F80266|nr:deoxyribodipyrimidine photo-lyase [Runella sp. MFBS21]MDF7816250.1 deoxyribodipyrimidine photo-lyase [Runella sp. MFBS21]
MNQPLTIFWFRRDLRLHDNAALYRALTAGNSVLPLFIFDKEILNQLEDKKDRRVEFIHQALSELQEQLTQLGSSIVVKYGTPSEVWQQLIEEYNIGEVYTNHDYEPYARNRDKAIGAFLNGHGIAFYTHKDQCIFEKNEVLSGAGTPYTVFTPYSRKWKETLNDFYLKSYPTEKYFDAFYKISPSAIPSLESMGFEKVGLSFPNKSVRDELIKNYKEQRDIPSIAGTSRLSVHLRFGTISIRELARKAQKLNETFLNELIWRDFYMQILWHFPHVGEGKAFRADYDKIEWRQDEAQFKKWCEGRTGYPIVDAGMRELNATGFMHNRVRMIVASFLTKHLLIDWRWGEAYFAQKLLDFDLSANNGGWQWASGSGTDAAPYFRIFNPTAQTQKFDPQLAYIKKWVPELNTFDYPKPIVDHAFARERCLKVYQKALKG